MSDRYHHEERRPTGRGFSACAISVSLFAASTAMAQVIPPADPLFEIASIKPVVLSASRSADMLETIQDSLPVGFVPMSNPSRVAIRNLSLTSVIALAFRLRKRHIAGPAWMADTRFNIDATLPPGADARLVNEMLQSLLKERFALKVHPETKDQPGYALVVGPSGPKLRRFSPPPGDLSATEGKASQPIAPFPVAELARSTKAFGETDENSVRSFLKLRGATLSTLAYALSNYTDLPVVDLTALYGKYDFDLRMVVTQTDREFGTPGVSLFEALKEFGLRLERRRVSVSVLVVDSVSKTSWG